MPQLPTTSTITKPRNPTSYHISTSHQPRQDDSLLYQGLTSTISNKIIHQQSTSWAQLELIERFTDTNPTIKELQRTAREGEDDELLDRTVWKDLKIERWNQGKCPWPPCTKSASIPYTSTHSEGMNGTMRFKLQDGGLYDSRNMDEKKGPFCSIKCRESADRFEETLGRVTSLKDKGKEMEEVGEEEEEEELEKRRKIVKESTKQLLSSFSTESRLNEDLQDDTVESKKKEKKKVEFSEDLLSNLKIHEHPPLPSSSSSTNSNLNESDNLSSSKNYKIPTPPSLETSQVDFERPLQRQQQSTSSPSSSSRFPSTLLSTSTSSSTSTQVLNNPPSTLPPFSNSPGSTISRSILSSSSSSSSHTPRRQPRSSPQQSQSQFVPREIIPGLNGFPPPRFVSQPKPVKPLLPHEEQEEEEDDGMEDEQVREWMNEALEVKRLVELGQL